MYRDYTVTDSERFKSLLGLDVAPIGLRVEKKQRRDACAVYLVNTQENLLSLCSVSDSGNIIEEKHVVSDSREQLFSNKFLEELLNKNIIMDKSAYYSQDSEDDDTIIQS